VRPRIESPVAPSLAAWLAFVRVCFGDSEHELASFPVIVLCMSSEQQHRVNKPRHQRANTLIKKW
jgi:hypothetical protein